MCSFTHKVIFLMPGFGTIDEGFEVLTLIQTSKTDRFSIVFMGKEFWEPLLDWIKEYQQNST